MIAVSVLSASPLLKVKFVAAFTAVPDFSYFINRVKSSESSAATVPTTFATTSEVAPVSFLPIKDVR